LARGFAVATLVPIALLALLGVVHGERDPMASARAARAFAERTHGRYAGFDAGHFVLLTRREETRASIADWLRRRPAAPARDD